MNTKKWIGTGAIALLIVVAAIWGTNPQLFQGLTRINTNTETNAKPKMVQKSSTSQTAPAITVSENTEFNDESYETPSNDIIKIASFKYNAIYTTDYIDSIKFKIKSPQIATGEDLPIYNLTFKIKKNGTTSERSLGFTMIDTATGSQVSSFTDDTELTFLASGTRGLGLAPNEDHIINVYAMATSHGNQNPIELKTYLSKEGVRAYSTPQGARIHEMKSKNSTTQIQKVAIEPIPAILWNIRQNTDPTSTDDFTQYQISHSQDNTTMNLLVFEASPTKDITLNSFKAYIFDNQGDTKYISRSASLMATSSANADYTTIRNMIDNPSSSNRLSTVAIGNAAPRGGGNANEAYFNTLNYQMEKGKKYYFAIQMNIEDFPTIEHEIYTTISYRDISAEKTVGSGTAWSIPKNEPFTWDISNGTAATLKLNWNNATDEPIIEHTIVPPAPESISTVAP